MKMNLRHKQSGSSLVVVIITLATLMVIVGVAAEYTTNINRNVQRSNTIETAIAVGDGCIDLLFEAIRAKLHGRVDLYDSDGALNDVGFPFHRSANTAANFPSSSESSKLQLRRQRDGLLRQQHGQSSYDFQFQNRVGRC